MDQIIISERGDPFKIDLLKQMKKTIFGLSRYNDLRIVINGLERIIVGSD
jgi:hypothetical protein